MIPLLRPIDDLPTLRLRTGSGVREGASFQEALDKSLVSLGGLDALSQPLDTATIRQLARVVEAMVARADPGGSTLGMMPLAMQGYRLPALPQVGQPHPVFQGGEGEEIAPPGIAPAPQATPMPKATVPTPRPVGSSGQEAAYRGLIKEAAERYDLDPDLITAVVRTESSFDANAVSPVGAQGLMQLMPATARDLGVTDAFDPRQNVMAGSRYLKALMDRYGGDRNMALAAYNWGMGNLERRPQAMPTETRNYVAKINRLLDAA